MSRPITNSDDSEQLELFLIDAEANGQIKVCRSDVVQVLIESKLETIQIVSFDGKPYTLESKNFNIEIIEEIYYKVKLRFINNDGSFVSNELISLDYSFLQRPTYMMYTTDPQILILKTPPLMNTNSNGEL